MACLARDEVAGVLDSGQVVETLALATSYDPAAALRALQFASENRIVEQLGFAALTYAPARGEGIHSPVGEHGERIGRVVLREDDELWFVHVLPPRLFAVL